MASVKRRGQGESPTSPRRVDAVDRARQALELRKAGKTFEYIAQTVGYATPSGAHKAIVQALQRTLQEPADEVRKLELERLDIMLDKTWQWIENGEPKAIDRALRIMERRAKYLGLDAPVKVAPTTPDGKHEWLAGLGDSDIDREIAAIVEQARTRAARTADTGPQVPLDEAGTP